MHKKYNLMCGRWQPYHLGHNYIVRKALDNNENVCIAIRDTPISEGDPYSVDERMEMISLTYKKEIAEGRVKVIVIPDISAISIGRKVGYAVNRYDPPENIKGISATAIREAMRSGDSSWQDNVPNGTIEFFEKQQGKVLWMTGPSGSGKTTISNLLAQKIELCGKRVKILDGDELRKGISNNLGLSPEDRTEHNRRVAHLARSIADVGAICIVALISPYEKNRTDAQEIIGKDRFQLVYIHSTIEDRIERDPKGLYKKAMDGEIKGLTGYDGDYDNPMDTGEEHIFVNTSEFQPFNAVEVILPRIGM